MKADDLGLSLRKIIKAYEIAYPSAIRVRKGSGVEILREETNSAWAGWFWCRSQDGQEGWISRDFMTIQGSRGTLNRDYDAKEVAVQLGEAVHVLSEERGWSWIKKGDGSEGWIPSENLESLEKSGDGAT